MKHLAFVILASFFLLAMKLPVHTPASSKQQSLLKDVNFSGSACTSDPIVKVNVPTSKGKNIKLELFDIQGNRIFSKKVDAENKINPQTIDLAYVSNGIYFVKVSDGDQSAIKKIVKAC